jgi:hypothetical protein
VFDLSDVLFITALIVVIFAVELGRRSWRQNEWKRRWRDRHDD